MQKRNQTHSKCVTTIITLIFKGDRMILEDVKEVHKIFGNPKNRRIGNLSKERNLKEKSEI